MIKILLIEDDVQDAEIIDELLTDAKHFSYELIRADSLAESREMITKDPDVILLDLGLPESSGIETYLKVKELFRKYPIIIMTGLDDEKVAETAVRHDAQDYLVKGEISSTLLKKSILYAIDRKLAQKKLLDNEARLREIFTTCVDGIISVDESMNFIRWNPGAEKILGYTADEVLGKSIMTIVPARYREEKKEGFLKYLKTGTGEVVGKTVEFFGLNKDGLEVPLEMTITTREKDGKYIATAFVRDVTIRKIAEEQLQTSLKEKELLLGEIHHRVKNNMQIIISLLNLQFEDVQDKEMLKIIMASENRIRSMAMIHEKLYQSKNFSKVAFGEYIRQLTTYLFDTYNVEKDKITLVLSVDNVDLSINKAIPCGLILNELVTNTIKYAFPEDKKGTLSIIMKQHEGNVILTVKDDGIGFDDSVNIEESDSLGMELITGLTQQLYGTYEIRSKAGACFNIEFPLEDEK